MRVGLENGPQFGTPMLELDDEPMTVMATAVVRCHGRRAIKHGRSELIVPDVPAVDRERHEPDVRAENSGVRYFRYRVVKRPVRHWRRRSRRRCRCCVRHLPRFDVNADVGNAADRSTEYTEHDLRTIPAFRDDLRRNTVLHYTECSTGLRRTKFIGVRTIRILAILSCWISRVYILQYRTLVNSTKDKKPYKRKTMCYRRINFALKFH